MSDKWATQRIVQLEQQLAKTMRRLDDAKARLDRAMQQNGQMQEALNVAHMQGAGFAHLVQLADIKPGFTFKCRCDLCRAAAITMVDAGQLSEYGSPDERWWERAEIEVDDFAKPDDELESMGLGFCGSKDEGNDDEEDEEEPPLTLHRN